MFKVGLDVVVGTWGSLSSRHFNHKHLVVREGILEERPPLITGGEIQVSI